MQNSIYRSTLRRREVVPTVASSTLFAKKREGVDKDETQLETNRVGLAVLKVLVVGGEGIVAGVELN